MIQKVCPRCHKLIPVGQVYCEQCRSTVAAANAQRLEIKHKRRQQEYNARRDPKYVRFYNSKEWRQVSRYKLQQAGYKCEAHLDGCQGLAVEVHHTIPLKTIDGWAKRFDCSALKAVCVSCHNKLDNRFDKPQIGVLDMKKIQFELSKR